MMYWKSFKAVTPFQVGYLLLIHLDSCPELILVRVNNVIRMKTFKTLQVDLMFSHLSNKAVFATALLVP